MATKMPDKKNMRKMDPIISESALLMLGACLRLKVLSVGMYRSPAGPWL